MRITKDQRIGGIPALKARQLARDLAHRGSYGCPREWLISFLTDYGNDRLTCDEAQQFLDAFVAEGYAEPIAERPDDLRTTVAGNALAMATARKPVLRRSADQAVVELAARAQAINDDPGYLFWVDWLELFGSYLDPAVDRLGDVDVYYRLARRYEGDEYTVMARQRCRQAEQGGRSFPTFTAELLWPETEVMRALKGRSAIISLVATPPAQLGAPSRPLFSRRRPPVGEQSLDASRPTDAPALACPA